jgi:hypothetical protein
MISRLAAATAVGVVLAGAVAAPAFAEDVIGVTLSSVPSSFTVGSRADTFAVGLRNNKNEIVAAVNVSFTIRLDGLTASQVRIHFTGGDVALHDSGGLITGTDPRSVDFLPRGRRDVGYSIEFLSGAPSGRATFTAAATRSGNIQGSASSAINVKGGAVAASASPTATSAAPTDPASPDNGSFVPPTGPGNAVGPLANNNQIPADSGGIPVALYIMGAVLVGVGGVILWMLFKQRPQPAAPTGFPTGEFDSPPPNLGYPVGRAGTGPRPPTPASASANLQPTAPLPALRGSTRPDPELNEPVNPPPPVDPWATRGGGGNRPRHGSD